MSDIYCNLCKHVIYMKNDFPVIKKEKEIELYQKKKKIEKRTQTTQTLILNFLEYMYHFSLKSTIFEQFALIDSFKKLFQQENMFFWFIVMSLQHEGK